MESIQPRPLLATRLGMVRVVPLIDWYSQTWLL
jgi:hypothetical protein